VGSWSVNEKIRQLKNSSERSALGKILGSDASILEVTKPYAKELLQQGYEAQSLLKNAGRDTRLALSSVKDMPKLIHNILRLAAAGKQRIELWHGGFEQMSAQLEKGVNRLTVGMIIAASIIAASIIAASMVLNSSQKVIEFSVSFMGLQTVSLTALLGLIGYLIATILGILLIWSIFRSGKL
jgi:ubiquinone biosynthesis protein